MKWIEFIPKRVLGILAGTLQVQRCVGIIANFERENRLLVVWSRTFTKLNPVITAELDFKLNRGVYWLAGLFL